MVGKSLIGMRRELWFAMLLCMLSHPAGPRIRSWKPRRALAFAGVSLTTVLDQIRKEAGINLA